MFSEVESALNLWDRFSRYFLSSKRKPLESVASRFVRLFEAHGVHRNQIPRFFGNGLTVADVRDDATLLPKLTEAVLDAAVELFAVRREWLDGAEEQIYPLHDFYKKPEEFEPFLDRLGVGTDKSFDGLLYVPETDDYFADSVFVIGEPIGWIGDKEINRYHICNNWLFTYWKSRAYLTACVAIAWRKGVYLRGGVVPAKQIESIANGNAFLELSDIGLPSRGKPWYPEDMALEPGTFLNRVDPERDNYGIKSGLMLWLELQAQGFMETGIPSAGNPRAEFEAMLSRYT